LDLLQVYSEFFSLPTSEQLWGPFYYAMRNGNLKKLKNEICCSLPFSSTFTVPVCIPAAHTYRKSQVGAEPK
jgi:hypothetical protein